MAFDAHKNFAYSTVATAPSPAASGTSLVVGSGHGTRFPTPPFNAVVWPIGALALPTNAEVIRISNIATDTLTIARAQEGSSARSIQVGDQIAANITAKLFTDIERITSVQFSTIDQIAAATAGTTETAFTTAYIIPANFFVANRALRVRYVLQATSSGSAPTLRFRLRAIAGSTPANIWTMPAISPANNMASRGFVMEFIIQGTAAPGASVPVMTGGQVLVPGATIANLVNEVAQGVNLDTTQALTLQLTLQYGANTAGNTVDLQQMIVQEVY